MDGNVDAFDLLLNTEDFFVALGLFWLAVKQVHEAYNYMYLFEMFLFHTQFTFMTEMTGTNCTRCIRLQGFFEQSSVKQILDESE